MYENDAFNLVLRDAIRLGQGRKLHEDMDIYRIVQDFSAHVYKLRGRSDERDWGPHARIWDHGLVHVIFERHNNELMCLRQIQIADCDVYQGFGTGMSGGKAANLTVGESYLPGPWWSLVRAARDAMFAKVEQLALELRQAEAARADEVTKAAAVVAEILARGKGGEQ